MSLFDRLVDEALKNQQDFAPLRLVVEKELLQHDILRVLSGAGLLAGLTFMGGTCLRACYGSNRLSEDLDFTGGADFSKEILSTMSHELTQSLYKKYGLHIEVSEPTRETGNVDNWKIKVQTRPGNKDLPRQRINIDVCSIPSYQRRPMMLFNPYGVEMGTGGLILQAESREEIFADKIVAFALRPNRIKYRDLWDIMWLHQRAIKLPLELIGLKIKDHKRTESEFVSLLDERRTSLKNDTQLPVEFSKEMQRFLPAAVVTQSIANPDFWTVLTNLVDDLCKQIVASV